jgi:nicotinamide phosphoribosyltransferase
MNSSYLYLTDSYKITHWRQYPPKTEKIYSYLESRGSNYAHGDLSENVFFGLQYYLREYLTRRLSWEDLSLARAMMQQHFGSDVLNIQGNFSVDGWKSIIDRYDGYLPVRICALPEGTVVPSGTPVMTVESLDHKLAWTTNFIETLLVLTWYPWTVASISRLSKKIILKHLERSGTPADVLYKLHDFGFRGSSSVESAALAGASHLVNFRGSDTLIALPFCMKYYQSLMPANSIPASEHSTITSWGKENEVHAMRNMLEQYPTGLVACVSDSYDILRACRDYWGKALREQVLSRNGVLIVRPDSGEPVDTVCQVITVLSEAFGTVKNEKGFKLLPPQVRIIQGDGVNPHTIDEILDAIEYRGFSADNIAFGMGGALTQQCDRDTMKVAFKASWAQVNNEPRDVYKEAPGKASKRGRFGVVLNQYSGMTTVPEKDILWPVKNYLEPVYEAGKILRHDDFDAIRKRAMINGL